MFKTKFQTAILMSTITLFAGGATAELNAGYGCEKCCPVVCAPPVRTTLCVKEPCGCCTYSVNVCLPAACCNEVPCVTWRRGFFGRKIATYRWKCCDHCIEVVVTRRGTAFVR